VNNVRLVLILMFNATFNNVTLQIYKRQKQKQKTYYKRRVGMTI